MSYHWPADEFAEMTASDISIFQAKGKRYTDLLDDKCWDCGAPTERFARLPACLIYESHCQPCGKAAATARLDQMNADFHLHQKTGAIEIRKKLMLAIRDPSVTLENRTIAREILSGMAK